MRPGAIHREQMSFARVRASDNVAAQVKEIKRLLESEIAADKKRKPRNPAEDMGLESLQGNELFFYHAPRFGSEHEYDDLDSIILWDSYAFSPNALAAMMKLVEATESLDRDVQIRWGSVDAGSIANVFLTLVGSDTRATAGPAYGVSPRFSYSTGEYFWDDEGRVRAFQPERQIAGLRAMIHSLKAERYYQEVKVDGLSRPVFAPKTTTSPGEVSGYQRADLVLDGKRFVAGMHEGMKQRTDSLHASLFSDDLATTREALHLVRKVVTILSQALGPPSDITITFECHIGDWPTQSKVLEKVGSTFSLVSVLLPYKRGFRPLAPQEIGKGEIHAYPLLILKRYREGIVPIRPLLAVNAVHASDGLWIELQSSGRTDLIDRAGTILGSKPQYWKGPPDIRWGWYPDRSYPGLTHGNCAAGTAITADTPGKSTAASAVVKRKSAGNDGKTQAKSASKSRRLAQPAKKKSATKKSTSSRNTVMTSPRKKKAVAKPTQKKPKRSTKR